MAKVLDRMPVSIRSLARQAGVSHVLLVKIRDGEARLTEDVGNRVIGALRGMAAELADLADELEATTGRER